MEWPKHHPNTKLDKDSPDHMRWIYEKAVERADLFGIEGVTYMLTIGVVKNVIPAIASTNALISAACVAEALKVATYMSKPIEDYLMYMGQAGINAQTFALERLDDCMICSIKPITLETARDVTLKAFLDSLCG